jgi:hypothetical protein
MNTSTKVVDSSNTTSVRELYDRKVEANKLRKLNALSTLDVEPMHKCLTLLNDEDWTRLQKCEPVFSQNSRTLVPVNNDLYFKCKQIMNPTEEHIYTILDQKDMQENINNQGFIHFKRSWNFCK